jgi:hypothetical protein
MRSQKMHQCTALQLHGAAHTNASSASYTTALLLLLLLRALCRVPTARVQPHFSAVLLLPSATAAAMHIRSVALLTATAVTAATATILLLLKHCSQQ